MKVTVAYDSVYGNTRLVAEAIAEQARKDGHSVEFLSLRVERSRSPQSDALFVGGPTHMGTSTRRVAHFIKKLDPAYWDQRPIYVFDTYGPVSSDPEEREKQSRWIRPGAAGDIQARAGGFGLKVFPRALRCPVTELRGPLAPDALDQAKEFTHEVLGATPAEPNASPVETVTPPKLATA